jgi:arabinan endo-1,5-alpha-L-arabinosidase
VLSGTDGFVEVADAPDLCPSTITMAAWVNLPVVPPKGGNFIAKGHNAGYRFRAVGGPVVEFLDRGAENIAKASAPLPLNQWVHVAVTGDGSGLRIFVNGTLAGSNAVPFAAPPTALPLKIGAETEFNEFVVGSMDEVCLFKKALTPAEVLALYRLGPKVASK